MIDFLDTVKGVDYTTVYQKSHTERIICEKVQQ